MINVIKYSNNVAMVAGPACSGKNTFLYGVAVRQRQKKVAFICTETPVDRVTSILEHTPTYLARIGDSIDLESVVNTITSTLNVDLILIEHWPVVNKHDGVLLHLDDIARRYNVKLCVGTTTQRGNNDESTIPNTFWV